MADHGSNSVPSSTHKTYKMYCPCQLKDNFNKETENFNIETQSNTNPIKCQYLFPPLIALFTFVIGKSLKLKLDLHYQVFKMKVPLCNTTR